MERYPDINVIGTSVEIFQENEDKEKTDDNETKDNRPKIKMNKIICHPISNDEIRWSMWFYCCFAHPTMMYRSSFISSYRYDMDHNEYSEDYSMWFRMMEGDTTVFHNISSPLLKLRKHSNNISTVKRNIQMNQSYNTVLNALLKVLESNNVNASEIPLSNDDTGIKIIACLQRPETSNTVNTMISASKMLLLLEKISLTKLINKKKASYIIQDTTSRLGAMSMIALQKYGSEAASLIQLWQDRKK